MKPTKFKHPLLIAYLFGCILSGYTQDKTHSIKQKKQHMMEYFISSAKALDKPNNKTEALLKYNKGSQIAQKLATDSVMAIAKMYKAVIDYHDTKYNLSNKAFSECLKIFKSFDKNHILIGEIYKHKGISYYYQGDLKNAKHNFEKAYQYFLNSEAKNMALISPLINLAHILFDEVNFKKSKEYMAQAVSIYNSDPENMTKNPDEDIMHQKMLIHIAYCDLYLGNLNQVEPTITRALNTFKTKKYRQGIQDYFKTRRDFEFNNSNFIEARNLSDSLIKYAKGDYFVFEDKKNKADSKNIENTPTKLEFSEKEKEVLKQKISTLKWGLAIASTFTLLLLAISIHLKQKNKTLNFLKVKTKQNEHQKSKFISMISHEIRTPINALLGFSKLLLEENPKEHQKKHLNALVSSSDYLLNLTNSILNLNENENTFLKVENHTIQMESFMDNISNAFILQTENNNNILNVNFDTKIPKRIKSDPVKIALILKTLLNNACKFTKNGQIWLNATLFENNSDHCIINFEVKDTGIGIPKDKFNSIFNTFSNAKLNLKNNHEGSGIGLIIVQKLIKAFDSEIIIESEPKQGSRFSFVLKMYKTAEDVKVIHNNNTDNFLLDGKNVLVVEDNKINQLLASKMLKKVNATPTICNNGLIGFEMFKSKPRGYFDFILMDIHMPIMDGYESTKLIKGISPNIPIIALTATNLKNDPEVLMEKQLDAVIYKPYEVEQVYEIVRALISTKRSA